MMDASDETLILSLKVTEEQKELVYQKLLYKYYMYGVSCIKQIGKW